MKQNKNGGNTPELLHEINNLLTTSGLSLELLLSESPGKLNNEQKNYLKDALLAEREVKSLLKKI